MISPLLSHIYGDNYSNIVVIKNSITQFSLLYCYYAAHTKIRLKASKIKKLFRPLHCLGALVRHFEPARIFNHRSFSVQPKYSKLHIYMCYYLFKHCAKLHEFNLSFSNNYFTFACEIGSQQPLIARMSRMSNHRSFTVKPKYYKLHRYICVLLFFQALCKITPIHSNSYF